jgi:hypothetical protein
VAASHFGVDEQLEHLAFAASQSIRVRRCASSELLELNRENQMTTRRRSHESRCVPVMFGLGDRAERLARREASAAEATRLAALAPTEFGALLVPAFIPGSTATKGDGGVQTMQILKWLAATNSAHPDLRPLVLPAQVALAALEQAGLLIHTIDGDGRE